MLLTACIKVKKDKMGNILQDMMGLLSRDKIVKEVELTDYLVLGRTPNPEGGMFVSPKMTNELITVGDLKLQTGSITLETNNTAGPATLINGVLNVPNYAGIVGPSGAAGADGTDGTDGSNGTNGTNGTNGAPGANGSDGSDGADGAPGSNGADGADGAQGVAGADGTSIEIQGTVNTVGDLPAAGNTVGDLWIIDQTGGGATAGDGYVWTVGNTWLNIGPLRGPQGVQGIAGTNGTDGVAGTPGATGPAGADGSDGSDGVDGVDGSNGANGAPGATGSAGPTGPQGPAGGVNSVTQGTNIVVSPTAGDVVVSAPNAIVNTTDNFGGPTVVNIVCLTSGQYPPVTVDGNTLYVII